VTGARSATAAPVGPSTPGTSAGPATPSAAGSPLGVGQVLERCRAEGRAALVGYLPVGFPTVEGSIEAMVAMVEAGVDVVEVGVPYSDPLMDGPVIQHAAAVALQAGARVDDVFRAVRAVRDAGAPPLVMTYWNLVLHRGVDRFAADLAAAGGAGLITPDLIPDEASEWLAASDREGLDRVFLVAPSSTPERLATVTSACRGFVYAASTMGVTGTRDTVGGAAGGLVERTRAVTDLPVCVGLGVSTRAQAAEVTAFADGVIVGSALVRVLDGGGELAPRVEALREVVADLAAGVREGHEQ
jgi:tryptophan synthase alpha chain